MLDDKDLSYEEINIDEEGISREQLEEITGGFTIPQIIINEKPIGGFEQLLLLNQKNKLDKLNDSI